MSLSPRIKLLLLAFLLAASILAIFWQAGSHVFINVDDQAYVYENPVVLRGLTTNGTSWAFATFDTGNWHPLTWLSHMLDVELFGSGAGWHHRMNVLFHIFNTELLFFVLWRMTGGIWQSVFVAALFGVHPLHVESVAWVSERKDVLSTLFWILTMGAYLRYTRRPSAGRYVLVIIPFALGLMCKPMLVTLPFVLLLLDIWPLGRATVSSSGPEWRLSAAMLSRLAWEKAPLLGLSAISCVVTYLAQAKVGAVIGLEHLPLGTKISNGLVSYAVYLWKIVWPSPLAVIYPHPATIGAGVPAWKVAGALLLLFGVSVLALRQFSRRPYFTVGWLWYLGTLVPVIGLVQVGIQAQADRYTYVPLIGIFITIAWGVPQLLSGWHIRRLVLGALGGVVLLALSVAAWTQAGYWRDSFTLFSHAVAATDRNWVALNNLGTLYDELGHPHRAIACYEDAIRIKPDYAKAWNNLGMAYGSLGQIQQAIEYYREALRNERNFAEARNNLGTAYMKLGQAQIAIDNFREALRIRPGYPQAWNNLGTVLGKNGQHQQAIDCFLEALRIKPDYTNALYNLSVAYARLGQREQALGYYRDAQRSESHYNNPRTNLDMADGQGGPSW